MDRDHAVSRRKELEGQDPIPVAAEYRAAIWRGDRKNKGWAGHVIERYLGLPSNSALSPNCGMPLNSTARNPSQYEHMIQDHRVMIRTIDLGQEWPQIHEDMIALPN
jgi:hypothetical protein